MTFRVLRGWNVSGGVGSFQKMSLCSLVVLLLLTAQAFSQVQVSVHPSKVEYLVGEPIFAIVHVTNVGPDPVAYSTCDGRVELNVEGQQTRQVPNLRGCFSGMGGGGGCGIDHPPMLAPGKSTDFSYLLRNYQIGAGEYMLRVSGKAGVRWKFTDFGFNNTARTRVSAFHEGDPIPGEHFDQTIPLKVRSGTEGELERAYEPYVNDAKSYDPLTSYAAREAISEMAPAFLEKMIEGFAVHPDTASFAVKGLQRLDTTESRETLVDLFDRSFDLRLRESIVLALAEMNSSDQLPFFASLLPGHSSEPEERIREYAALAIGRLGGDGGVDQLASFLKTSGSQASPGLRSAIAIALASGKSKKAVPILINLYGDSDGLVRNSVCGSLISLTHRYLCDDSAPDQVDLTPLHDWWRNNAATTRLYGFDECIKLSEAKPLD